MKESRLHCWVPDVASAKGGIQEFSNRLLEAIGACRPTAEISVFSKNDIPSPPPVGNRPNVKIYGSGRWPERIRTLAYSARIISHALRRPPTAILATHLHFSPAGRLINKFAATPYAVVAHGIDAWGLDNTAVINGLCSANLVLAVSRFTRDRLVQELAIDPGRVKLLPNTFDSTRFRPGPKPKYLLERFGLREDQPVILTICRMPSVDRYKGYDQILRALPGIKKKMPNVRYILGGTGADRTRIEQLIHSLDLSETAVLPGFIPDGELCDYYNLCDVFAMPSRAEGFGIVFLEALSCGKAVIAGDNDGSVDAVLDGTIGCLVNPESVEDIAGSLHAVLSHAHPLEILRRPQQLRQRVIEAYGFERFVKTVDGHLNSLGVPPGANQPIKQSSKR